MTEYKRVWIDKRGGIWMFGPNDWAMFSYGPFQEGKIVPFDAEVVEPPLVEPQTEGARVEVDSFNDEGRRTVVYRISGLVDDGRAWVELDPNQEYWYIWGWDHLVERHPVAQN